MATTNANESRARENYQFDYKSRKDFVPKESHKYGDGSYRQGSNSNKSVTNSYRSADNKQIPRAYDHRPAENGYKPKDYKADSYSKSKDFGKSTFNYKDEDDEIKTVRSHKSMNSKSKSTQQEQLPDKFETIKRLEREKKAMQKKQREEDEVKQKRPTPKKRSSKSDWTKEYVYDLMDEDEDYSVY